MWGRQAAIRQAYFAMESGYSGHALSHMRICLMHVVHACRVAKEDAMTLLLRAADAYGREALAPHLQTVSGYARSLPCNLLPGVGVHCLQGLLLLPPLLLRSFPNSAA